MAELERLVERLAEHLRRLPESRLRRHRPELGEATAADAAHALAQWLADTAAALAADESPAPPPRVPRLSDLAVGDQVAVTGAELVAAARESSPGPALDDAVRTALARVALVLRAA